MRFISWLNGVSLGLTGIAISKMRVSIWRLGVEEAIWVEVHMLRRTASGSSYGCRDKHVNLAEECGSPQPLHRMSAKTLHS